MGDLDEDGVLDVIVGSPFSYGDGNVPLAGKVEIFYSAKSL